MRGVGSVRQGSQRALRGFTSGKLLFRHCKVLADFSMFQLSVLQRATSAKRAESSGKQSTIVLANIT